MSTPIMKQYNKIKEEYQDHILFFRLGDFYEMFYEDAKIASQTLGIALTSRHKDSEVPMAGVPYHSASSYVAKLINAGYKVAMCEQIEDPVIGKIVKRAVTKVITPGTFGDLDYIDGKSNNYILSFCAGLNGSAISYADLTIGEFKTVEFGVDYKKAMNEIFRIAPREIVVTIIKDDRVRKEIEEYARRASITITEHSVNRHEEIIKEFFNINNLQSFGLDDKRYSKVSSAVLLDYISRLQNCSSIKKIVYEDREKLYIDHSSIVNLNLFIGDRSLLSIIDNTKSALGGRFLKKALASPLTSITSIGERFSDVEYFIDNPLLRSEMSNALKGILDFERSYNRILRGDANIRDLNAIKKSLVAADEIFNISSKYFNIDHKDLAEYRSFLESSILDSNAISIKEGGIIKPSFNEELFELNRLSTEGKNYLFQLEERERSSSGIKNLKIGYNKVFGYYIEVTRANLSLVPDGYIRKQTLTNAERYITEELKVYEEKILNAKERMCELEFELFNDICSRLSSHHIFFERLARDISYLDFIISMSESALKHNYVKPNIKDSGELILKGSRHPIVESAISNFVANDIDIKDGELIILTGPNMSGKSTFMKQVALISLMAQVGSFVPASYAELPILDKIFTRVGASDDILSGQSTFMVEMNEVANIINNATDRSLVILDEVGRGTSTFDGISIAKSVTEYIHDKIGAKTIFATHYHELNELETLLDRVTNYRFEVDERRDEVIFLNKIVKGNADKSYGIEVARLAGLPKELLDRSRALLSEMSMNNSVNDKSDPFSEDERDIVLKKIMDLDLDHITPMELYTKIQEIKKLC